MNSNQLIFILGPARSGTTWLQRLVASHDMIKTGTESNIFLYYIDYLIKRWSMEPLFFDGRGPNGLCCYVNYNEFQSALREFILNIFKNIDLKEDEFFLEKTTSHVCSIKNIFQILPESKIILIHRNPFEVIPSLLKAGKSWGKSWGPKQLEGACEMWRTFAKCIIKATKEQSEQISNQLYIVRFDDLRESPQDILISVFHFLNIPISSSEAQSIINRNRPGSSEILKIPYYGEYFGKYVEEPEGFMRTQNRKNKISIFSKIFIFIKLKKEMKELGYNYFD